MKVNIDISWGFGPSPNANVQFDEILQSCGIPRNFLRKHGNKDGEEGHTNSMPSPYFLS